MTIVRMTPLAIATAFAGAMVLSPAIAQKADPAKAATVKKAKAAPSACAGLGQAQCSAKTECGWITPKKKVSTNGRQLKAYCRKVAGIAKKK